MDTLLTLLTSDRPYARCRIKSNWDEEGKQGNLYGRVQAKNGQQWAIVVWDGDDEPELHKAAGLEYACEVWKPV